MGLRIVLIPTNTTHYINTLKETDMFLKDVFSVLEGRTLLNYAIFIVSKFVNTLL